MTTISTAIDNLAVDEPQNQGHLTVFGLINRNAATANYLTLDEALEHESALVTEISDGGAVPDLRFANLCDTPILLIDGEELVGARQNRVLNLTILVAGHAAITIPVSCVERGRWAYTSREFRSGKGHLFAAARAAKMGQVSESLRTTGTRRSDQSAVWNEIGGKASRLAAYSRTEAMSDVYLQAESRIDQLANGIQFENGTVGAAFAIDGHILGVELFDAPNIFHKVKDKLLRSYAIDAIEAAGHRAAPPTKDAVAELLKRVKTATTEEFEALGEGQDLRLRADGLVGAALVNDDRVVHLSAFAELA